VRWVVAALVALVAHGVAGADELADEAARQVGVARARPTPDDLVRAAEALWVVGQRSSALERHLQALVAGGGANMALAARRLGEDPVFPLSPSAMDRLAARSPAGLGAALRAGLEHRVGLHLLRAGRLEAAAQRFARLDARQEARYLLGAALLQQGRGAAARAAFDRALVGGDAEVQELAQLALARMDGAAGRLDAAAAHYAAVPYGSPHYFRARQELAWVELQRGDAGAALTQSVILRAPRLRRYHRPDGELVEAAAHLGLCRLDEARSRAQLAQRRLSGSLAALSGFLRHRADVRLYYVEAMASAAGRSRALSRELIADLLADASFRRAFVVVRQLQRERTLLLGPGASALRRAISGELDQRVAEAQAQAGRTVLRILGGLAAELKDLRLRAQELLFDVESRASLRGSPRRLAPPDKVVAPGRQQRWPFHGEYWSDEVSHFTVRTPSSCP
jgi:hypothetical protein